MKFRTEVLVDDFATKLSHGDRILSLGSCFSENVGNKLQYFGFKVLNNPFGTFFHPLAMAEILNRVVTNPKGEFRMCQRDGRVFSYDVHGKLSGASENELTEILETRFAESREFLKRAKMLILTFGTAWGYYLDERIVANCHKQPASLFSKRLTEVEEMQSVWRNLIKQIKILNPEITIITTVSPVRHIRDGIIENNRSKSRLIELVHALGENYFPSYELFVDDLRDYRFCKDDLVHPSEFAIQYIFDKFSTASVASETLQLFGRIDKLRKAEMHRVMSDGNSAEHFYQEQTKKREGFLKENPLIVW